MYIHKNNVKLCKLERFDIPSLIDLKNESWFGTHKISILNRQDQDRWFEKISDSHNDLVLTAYHVDDICRRIGIFKIFNIDWMNRSCEIGQDIFKDYRGQGFGYKIVEAGIDFCFEILNMNRLNAEVLENNLASKKTLLNGGFVMEGTKRKAVHKCGQYLDSLVLGVLKEDWVNLERVTKLDGICNISYKPMDSTDSR